MRNDPGSGTPAVREARSGDAPRLAEIARLSPEAGRWPESDLLASLAEPTRRCLVAEWEGRIAGFLLASRPAPEEAEILTLAVDPAARRRGVARALLGSFLHTAFGAARGRMWLEVRASNVAAQRLYGSFGFAQSGVRRGYYASPAEDAIVMQLTCF